MFPVLTWPKSIRYAKTHLKRTPKQGHAKAHSLWKPVIHIYKYTWPNQIMLGLTRFMNIDIFCTDLTKTRSSSNSLWIINGNISSFGLTKTRLCWLNRVVWQMKMKKYVHETICKALFSRPLKFFLADYLSKVIHAFWKWSCSLESNECKRLSDE